MHAFNPYISLHVLRARCYFFTRMRTKLLVLSVLLALWSVIGPLHMLEHNENDFEPCFICLHHQSPATESAPLSLDLKPLEPQALVNGCAYNFTFSSIDATFYFLRGPPELLPIS